MKPQQRSSTRLLSKVVAARPESHAMNKVMKHLPDEPDIRKMDDFLLVWASSDPDIRSCSAY